MIIIDFRNCFSDQYQAIATTNCRLFSTGILETNISYFRKQWNGKQQVEKMCFQEYYKIEWHGAGLLCTLCAENLKTTFPIFILISSCY